MAANWHQDDERDRERPSWREIDQRRDRPGRSAPRQPRPSPKQAERVRQRALRQAEALFQGHRGRPEYQAALQELERAHGTKKFPAVARQFLAAYGLPEDWGPLTWLLDYPESAVVVEGLQRLAGQVGERSRVERQGFEGRLRVLALTSRDEEVRRQAEELLALLT